MIEVRAANFPDEVAIVRVLFEEYAAGLGIDLDFQGFEAELAGLPGKYAPPAGRLLLANAGPEIAGCIGLRPLAGDTCEMKRLYLRPAFRGQGLARLLVAALLAEARAAGYRRICLDTLPTMRDAVKLYESLGFRDIAPYCHNPVPGARFLGLEL